MIRPWYTVDVDLGPTGPHDHSEPVCPNAHKGGYNNFHTAELVSVTTTPSIYLPGISCIDPPPPSFYIRASPCLSLVELWTPTSSMRWTIAPTKVVVVARQHGTPD